MNTTPSTSSSPRTTYTVVGRHKPDRLRKHTTGTGLVLLDRGGRFNRAEVLEEYRDGVFAEILCVSIHGGSRNVEELVDRYPRVRFVLLEQQVTVGEQINIAFEEIVSPQALVLWTDMKLDGPVPAEDLEAGGVLGLVPLLRDRAGKVVPSLHAPAMVKDQFRPLPWAPSTDASRTLFPFDFVAMYCRVLFRQLGGFHAGLRDPFWQTLDFGFRAALWGHRLLCRTSLKAAYRAATPTADTTRTTAYKVFYLRNLAVVFNGEGGRVPWRRLPGYLMASDTGPVLALREFLEARRWVALNQFRFRQDAGALVAEWEAPE